MEIVSLQGQLGSSRITIGESFSTISAYFDTKKVFIITDQNVQPMVSAVFPDLPIYTILPGEHSKSLRNATDIYRWLQTCRADRKALIVGIGGGVVCDLAGFVAATYLRGVRLFLIPTTLLSQVDASVGGKNAVNLDGFKNIVGTVYQPERIVLDTNFLFSLPEHEVKGGFAEVIKHTIISDESQFEYMLERADSAYNLDHQTLEKLVTWSVQTKKRFVEMDEFDRGERRKLNFGHTWGHAVESVTGMHHGFAISIGMCFSARLGEHLGITSRGTYERIENILTRYGLPTTTSVLPWVIYEAMLKDKKREHGDIHFIFPRTIGEVVVERIPVETIKTFVQA